MLLADGSRVRVAADEHPDLFWAACGGGGNFGIVTEFEIGLHRLGTEVLAGPLLYPADHAREVLNLYREVVASAPDELSLYFVTRTAPDLEWVPAELRGAKVLVLVACYSGDLDAGEAVLERLRTRDRTRRGPDPAEAVCLTPDDVRLRRPPRVGLLLEIALPAAAHRRRDRRGRGDGLGAVIARPPTASSSTWAGQSPSRPADASAASGRDAAHALNINASWTEGGPEHPDIGWCRAYADAMAPHATGGVYVNFLHNDEGEARVRASYGTRYERLAQIKAQVDPDNTFRSNQNIRPGAA